MVHIGRYIALEGIDGVGKTTHVRLLKDWVREKGVEVYLTKEPSEGPIGRMVETFWREGLISAPKPLALLFAADTLLNQQRKEGVLPQLELGRFVISDRSFLSTYAYLWPDCDWEWLDSIHRYCHPPDLTIFLDLSPDVAIRRLMQSRLHLTTFENREALWSIREHYLYAISVMKERNQKIEVLPIEPEASVSHVQEQIRHIF